MVTTALAKSTTNQLSLTISRDEELGEGTACPHQKTLGEREGPYKPRCKGDFNSPGRRERAKSRPRNYDTPLNTTANWPLEKSKSLQKSKLMKGGIWEAKA